MKNCVRSITINLILGLTVLLSSSAWADCPISQTLANDDSPLRSTYGHSFTAVCDGNITSITVNIASGYGITNGTLNLYNGESVATSIYTQSNINLSDGVQTITMTTPVPVTVGLHTFTLSGANSFRVRYSDSNPYADGQAFFVDSFVSFADGYFEIQISESGDPIPTLSEWGMIIMSLILGASAFYTIRRKRSNGTWA